MGLVSITTLTDNQANVNATELNQLATPIVSEFNGNIENVNIKAGAAIAWSKLNTTGQIQNADVKSTAAIAGTKISPDFGTQNVTTTGEITGNSLQLPETTAPSTSASEAALYTKDTSGQPELFFREESDGDEVQLTNAGSVNTPVGGVVQIVNTQSGAVATGTTAMVLDDSIPQITEGDEYMTRSITPKSSTNKLKIDVVFNFAQSATQAVIVALFQDTTANALAAAIEQDANSDTKPRQCIFTHYMNAGTTSSTTFRVRAGIATSGTLTFNGVGGARLLGGVYSSSITITEIKV